MDVQHPQEQLRGAVPPGLIEHLVDALTNPPPPSPEKLQCQRETRWELAVREVREVEAALEAVRAKFPDDGEESSRVRHIVAGELSEAKRELLDLEAPHVEGLKLKMAAFLEEEGDLLDGPVLEALQGVFADVERLLLKPIA